jgi:hypothetical protein
MSKPKGPKPMSREELERAVRAIGWDEGEVRRRVGIPVLQTRKRIKSEEFTQQQTRCIRFLAMNPEIRSWVEQIKAAFPAMVMTAVRPVETDPKK